MKIKSYHVINRAIEEGIEYGYRRAHKYTEKPTEWTLFEEIERAIMNELCEVIDFDDEVIDMVSKEE